MQAGAAEIDITPEGAIELCGFAARVQPSTGALDRIFAKALYLEDERGERFLWIVADLIAFDAGFVRAFRAWARDTFNLSSERVLLSATHTHSAPATIRLVGAGRMDEKYLQRLMIQVQEVAREAVKRLTACDLVYGSSVLNLAVDRRNKPSAHTDSLVSAIALRKTNGDFLAVVANYAMHPVALGSVNRQISGDWCSGTARSISAMRGSPIALVTNGAAGNLNPPREGVLPEIVYGYGREVAKAVAGAIETATAQAGFSIRSERVDVAMDVPTPEQIDRVTEKYLATIEPGSSWDKPFREALLTWQRDMKSHGRDTVSIELQSIRIGGVLVVAVNGEMFSRFTQIIRDGTRKPLFVVAYSNEAFGYIPTREAYTEGGYEVETAHFFYQSFRPKPGALELLAERAAEMIEQMSDG
jgi:neutral ceramidase